MALGWRGNRRSARDPLAVAETLVVAEEERFVARNRPANRRSELVLLERFDVPRKEIARVKYIVAEEFVSASVKPV